MKKPATDQRRNVRNATAVSIICEPYTSGRAQRSVDGVLCNFSDDGFYMETTHPFLSGHIVIVRTLACLPTPISSFEGLRPRSISLAEVRWQQELAAEANFRYGLGLRYLDWT